MTECKGQPRLQKVVAIAIFLKYKLGQSSIMRNYSVNKIHTLTKISATTIKKYLPILKQCGFVDFCGKNNQHLIVTKLCSHTKGRNVKIDNFCFDSYKDVYKSLRAYLALIIQSHKDFVKRTIQIAANPKNWNEFIAARKYMKRLVKQGVLCGLHDEYREYGLSFKRIAIETGNCARTAQRIMNYAINKGWVSKKRNFKKIFMPKINRRQSDIFTFSTLNNIYIVYANTYELNILL